ncbi:MAG TPA: protein kinase [Ktedonobacteraceae bacterium]|nr:protein kinase [Ktedonobacteraceae bacterium]
MDDRTGQKIGNYQLMKLLGQGGFAEVYLGEHIYLKTQAAIKLLTRLSEQNDLDAFLKEARIIANLAHPNIVRVLEFGEHENIPYLVMDYAPAGTLRNQYPRGSLLAVTQVVTYVRQVAAALQYAHDHKIVHCDVKPENMLVGRNGEILLSDFGIAVVSQTSRHPGSVDVGIGGTIAYMAPEQLQGRASIASDQYALGVVAYEWLTGTRPFNGSFTEIGSQHIFAVPPSAREKVSSISPEIDRVLQTVLAKDPRQRYASIQAFAHALEHASLIAGSGFYAQPVYANENAMLAQQKMSHLSSPYPMNAALSLSHPSSPYPPQATPLPVQPPPMHYSASTQEGSLSSFPSSPPAEPARRFQKRYFMVLSVLVFLLIGSGLWGFFIFHRPGNTVAAHAGTVITALPTSASTVTPAHTSTPVSTPGSTLIPAKAPGITPTLAPTPTPTANIYAQHMPLYRLDNSINGDHFYTMSAQERDGAVAHYGYHSEGIAGYLFPTQVANTQPLYRLNGPNGAHFYTMSAQERDAVVAHNGYHYEAIAGYLFSTQVANTQPLYRLSGPNSDYFYTMSAQERDAAVAQYSYHSEGIAGYLFAS